MRSYLATITLGLVWIFPSILLAQPKGDGETKLAIRAGTDVIAAYQADFFEENDESEWFHEFYLDRAFVWLGASYGIAHSRVLLEGAYSTGDSSVFAVAGDANILRIREAFAGVKLWDRVTIEGGVIPTLVQPTWAASEGLRIVGQESNIATGLLAPSDLGVRALADLPLSLGTIGVAFSNGDGLAARELNRGKNIELLADVSPLAFAGDVWKGLRLRLGYQLGSIGRGSIRNDRFFASISYESETWALGAANTLYWGYLGDGKSKGALMHLFARAALDDFWLVGARAGLWFRNLDQSDDRIVRATLSAGVRVEKIVDAMLFVRGEWLTDAAGLALGGSDRYSVGVALRTRFEGSL